MQELSLQKKKSFDNFLTEKLSKKSVSYQNDVFRTLRRLDEYTILTHNKRRDEIIDYLRSISEIEKREDETIGWIQGFIDKLSEFDKISFKVLQVYLSHIRKYLKYFKIRIDFGDEIELPSALLEERYVIPIENIQEIIENCPWKYKGYFLSLISSGARPIEIMALRKKDFIWMNTRWKAIIPAKYTKKKISRTVFFSFEVTSYLNKLLGKSDDDDRIWTKNPKLTDDKLTSARLNAGAMFRKICNKLGFTERYETTNFFKYNMYCFRSHFFTKALHALTEDKDTAHAMIGHGAYLQTYQRRTDKEKLELFMEVESEILINSTARKQFKLDKMEKEKSELEKVNLFLHQTIKEKDEMAQKSNDTFFSSNVEKLISQKVKEILEKQNIN